LNAYLTPQATAHIKAQNAKHIAANNQRRLDREFDRLMVEAMTKPRDVPAFVKSGFVSL
jgi:hypothetical protein